MVNITSILPHDLVQEYPCVKQNDVDPEFLVLYINANRGIVLRSPNLGVRDADTHPVGRWGHWEESTFSRVSVTVRFD